MHNTTALMQQVNTYLSLIFIGAFALGAAYLIMHVASKEDYGNIVSTVIEQEGL